MKKSGLILIVLLLITISFSGCEIKKSEEKLREEIRAELEAEQAAEAKAKEEAEKEAAIKIEEEQTNQLVSVQSDRTLKIMTERLNVRRDPVLDSTKVGTITNDKTYEFLEEEVRTNGYKWYKVIYEPEAEGWIAGWYTLKNSEFMEKIGRGNLLNAFDGKLDGKTVGIGDNISSYIEVYGEADTRGGFSGGEVFTFGLLTIFTYGDMGGDIEVGDILHFIYASPNDMYGIQIGMSKEEVIAIIGEADVVELDITDDFNNLYLNNDLHRYYTGSQLVILVYNTQGTLERIELAENN